MEVTVRLAVIVTVHTFAELLSQPFQLANTDPVAATAVSVTVVPPAKVAWQLAPQAMPRGELVTVPVPVPAFKTLRVAGARNVAVTVRLSVMVTVHVFPELLSQPLQPANTDPASSTAVSVTVVPLLV